MMLPKPRRGRECLETYSRRLARSQIPTGGKKVKYAKNLIWRVKGRSANTIILDLEGPCRGPLKEVMDIGVREAQSALIRSKQIEVLQCKATNPAHTAILIAEQTPEAALIHRQAAGRILKRLNELPREYEIRQLLTQLQSARTRQQNEISEEHIREARLWELTTLKALIALHAGQKTETIDLVAQGAIAT